jgi:Polyketide cyclase / dehydrase and lipid transport
MQAAMPTIHLTERTSVPPERIVAALTDFSDARPSIWPSLAPDHYEVHSRGEDWAEVTEGADFAGGVWERGRYDWSQPGVVRFTVSESNAFAAGSSWEYRVQPDGTGSVVDLTVSRRPATPKGQVLALLLRIGGKRALGADLRKALDGLSAS